MKKKDISKIAFSVLVIIMWVVPILAQVDTAWVRRYNGPDNSQDAAYGIAVDGSGNVYVTGSSVGNGTFTDYSTIKYYFNGDTAWVRRYNGPANRDDGACYVDVDDAGNVYVTGGSAGSGTSYDMVTIKYYSNGDTAWVQRFNGSADADDVAGSLALDDFGNVYVTGYSAQTKSWPRKYDYVTIKYRSNGDTAWMRSYDGAASDDLPNALSVDRFGNVYVTGESDHTPEGTGSDFITIKYDSSGSELWIEKYNGPGNDYDAAKAIFVDDSGYVYVTGKSNQTAAPEYNLDFATIKYYPNGDTVWVRRYNGPGNWYDSPNAISVDGSGNVYVTGESYGSGTDMDYATIKYTLDGDVLWVRRYDCGGGPDWAADLVVDDSNNVYVTGTGAGGGHPIFAAIKYDLNGQELWTRRHDVPTEAGNSPQAIAIDDFDNVYVTGTGFFSGTYEDYVTVKYVDSPIKCGDANGDSKITVSDAVYLVSYLFKGGPAPVPKWKANIDCDSQTDVSVSDVVYLINYLFKGGPPPGC